MSKVKKMHALAKEIRQEGESYNEAVSRASQMMKDQEATQQEMGLGDVVETITEATGIKAVVDWFSDATGIDCGCEARKEKLNELFKTKRNKPQCWDESDYNSFKAFLPSSLLGGFPCHSGCLSKSFTPLPGIV